MGDASAWTEKPSGHVGSVGSLHPLISSCSPLGEGAWTNRGIEEVSSSPYAFERVMLYTRDFASRTPVRGPERREQPPT